MNEKISVLMPVYNREDFVERAIRSIQNQTYGNFELLVYNDGSSDRTYEIIRSLMHYDNRIRLCDVSWNLGVGKSRNELLKRCNTKYAIWMDSDDISYPDRIELQLKEMTEDKLVFCTWENLAKKKPGTTKGFATLMFPVRKDITFDETMQFGGEDWKWIEEMRILYSETLIEKVLYSIDFHGNRIGSWKRKLCKDWGGIFDPEELEGLTYSEAVQKFQERNNE